MLQEIAIYHLYATKSLPCIARHSLGNISNFGSRLMSWFRISSERKLTIALSLLAEKLPTHANQVIKPNRSCVVNMLLTQQLSVFA